jgi:hypothetical protein
MAEDSDHIWQQHQATLQRLQNSSCDFQYLPVNRTFSSSVVGKFAITRQGGKVVWKDSKGKSAEEICIEGISYLNAIVEDGAVVSLISLNTKSSFGLHDIRDRSLLAMWDVSPVKLLDNITFSEKYKKNLNETKSNGSITTLRYRYASGATHTLHFDEKYSYLIVKSESSYNQIQSVVEVTEFSRSKTGLFLPKKIQSSVLEGGKSHLHSTLILDNWIIYSPDTVPNISWSPRPDSTVYDNIKRKEIVYGRDGKVKSEKNMLIAGPPIPESSHSPSVPRPITKSEATSWWMYLAPLSLVLLAITGIYVLIMKVRQKDE